MIEDVEIVEPNLSISPRTSRAVLVTETMTGRTLAEKGGADEEREMLAIIPDIMGSLRNGSFYWVLEGTTCTL